MQATAMYNSIQHPIHFRNHWLLVAFVNVGSLAAIFLAGCMFILAMTELFPLHSLNFTHAINCFGWLFGTFCFGLMCPSLWAIAGRMRYNQAVLTPQGVEFRFGPKSTPGTLSLAWDQIVSIRRQRNVNVVYFVITGKDGSSAEFSSYVFFRPVKLARLLARYSGLVIQKV